MKVGDRVQVVRSRSGGFPAGVVGIITAVSKEGVRSDEEWCTVDALGDWWYHPAEELKLLPSEPAGLKGQCLTDATQDLYTALKGLIQTATRVEAHLITHPYQKELVTALHVAQEAIDRAENGELAGADRSMQKQVALASGYKTGPRECICGLKGCTEVCP